MRRRQSFRLRGDDAADGEEVGPCVIVSRDYLSKRIPQKFVPWLLQKYQEIERNATVFGLVSQASSFRIIFSAAVPPT